MSLVDEVHAAVLSSGRSGLDDVTAVARKMAPLLSGTDLDHLVGSVVARVGGFGALDPYLADPSVTDVMINGGSLIWVERAGVVEAVGHTDAAEVARLIERILAPLGVRADRSSPMVDARLPDGSRVHVVMPPVAVDGPCLTVRRFGAKPVGLEDMCGPDVQRLLIEAVRSRRNLLVIGGTGSGKTTLLNALATAVPGVERIVTIEDAAELRLNTAHVVRLEARPGNADGLAVVTIRDLVRAALRMRPDRIVVGEVRGAEALDMLQAMNSGHEGSMSTCHANGSLDALRRLETMVLFADTALPLHAVRHQIGAALDVVVQVRRLADGKRRVVAVAEVVPDGASVVPIAEGDRVVAGWSRPPRITT